MSKILNAGQIKEIPNLLKTMTMKEVSFYYHVHERTINRWVKILRQRGYDIPLKRGMRPFISQIF